MEEIFDEHIKWNTLKKFPTLESALKEIQRLSKVNEDLKLQNDSLLEDLFVGKTIYAVRVFDRDTEDDPHLAAVMYSSSGQDGPWHDIVFGHPDWCWEVLEALYKVAKKNNLS
jgi:hypothetical protein